MKLITWGEYLGNSECPYVKRWILNLGLVTIRLHRWYSSDDQRYFHDHPWWYVTLILKGGYIDLSPLGNVSMKAGSIAYHRAVHQHSVKVNKEGCWSLLLTGRESRVWGFWVNGKFRKRNKYFYEHGHHPCEKGESNGQSKSERQRFQT